MCLTRIFLNFILIASNNLKLESGVNISVLPSVDGLLASSSSQNTGTGKNEVLIINVKIIPRNYIIGT